MKREKLLVRLLRQYRQRNTRQSMSDDEAARIAAAEMITQLNSIEVPANIAARLEARVRAQARSQQNGKYAVSEQQPLVHVRSKSSRPIFRRAWMGALSAATMLLLVILGMANAIAGSHPGDPLYNFKYFEQLFAQTQGNDQVNRANFQISQLRSAVSNLDAVVNNGGTDSDIARTLTAISKDMQACQAAVKAVPPGSQYDTVARSLTNVLSYERDTLYHLLAHVSWPLQLAFTQQLGVLGKPVPAVKNVAILSHSKDTLTLQLTGTNFTSGMRLVINGQPIGTITQYTPTLLIVVVKDSNWSEGEYNVGVLSSDGTAAQITWTDDPDNDDTGNHGTPVAGSTAEPGDDHGGQSGSGHGTSGSSSTPEPGDDRGGGSGSSHGGSKHSGG